MCLLWGLPGFESRVDRRTNEFRGGPGFFFTCRYSQTQPFIRHKEQDGLSRLPGMYIRDKGDVYSRRPTSTLLPKNIAC